MTEKIALLQCIQILMHIKITVFHIDISQFMGRLYSHYYNYGSIRYNTIIYDYYSCWSPPLTVCPCCKACINCWLRYCLSFPFCKNKNKYIHVLYYRTTVLNGIRTVQYTRECIKMCNNTRPHVTCCWQSWWGPHRRILLIRNGIRTVQYICKCKRIKMCSKAASKLLLTIMMGPS